MFVKLESRRVLVVGAGKVGEPKIASLLDTGAQITVVAPEPSDAVRQWAGDKRLELKERGFEPHDLDEIFLAIVATSSPVINHLVFSEAERRGVLCNVVDVPDQCHFFYPAVVRRGDLQIAISTSGQSPFLAQRLRQRLEKQFGSAYADWVNELGATRREVLKSNLSAEQKRELLQSLASRHAFEALVARNSQTKGDAA